MPVPVDEYDGELELRDYLRVLRRRRWIVVVTTAAIVGLSMVLSYLQTPIYAGAARMLVEPRPSTTPLETSVGARIDTAQFVATEIEVLEGELVQAFVREELPGGAPAAVSARQVGTTAVVQITAESTDPKLAAATANAYVTAYQRHRRQQAVDASLAAQAEVQSKIQDLQGQIDDLDREAAAGQGSADSLKAQKDGLITQQALFKQAINQYQLSNALAAGGAEIVQSARVPSSPVRPTPLRNGILALVVGAMVGVGLAFLREYLDDSIENGQELERAIGGVPVIAEIPEVVGWKTKDKVQLVAKEAPRSPPAESYRALRTALDFIAINRSMRTLMVTSPGPGEGKTTTLANLGITLATAGQRVVIVCCDLRRPRIHEFFGLANTVGFTSILLGERPVSAALQAVPGVPRLRLLASGPLPPNPSELLSSQRTADVFTALTADTDIILIDSPPVLPVTDALVLFRHVDATLMVFSAGTTTRKEAAAAMAKVQQVDGPVIGAVLNGVKSGTGYGYGYGRYESATPRPVGGGGDGAAVRNGSATNGAGPVELPASDGDRPRRRKKARP